MAKVIYIMGVSGSGKSTIGLALSRQLDIPFFDGDDFHPPANVEKMQKGQALDDTDRQPWLEAIAAHARAEAKKKGAVIACSALKESYRTILSVDLQDLHWVFLEGSMALIQKRMEARSHFMPVSLLQSQFDTLEKPETAITVDIRQPIELILQKISRSMQQSFGLIGLGVMGKSLARNLASRGFKLALYNRHLAGKEEDVAVTFIKMHTELADAAGFDDLSAFIAALERPRKILLMVNAGTATQTVLNELEGLLQPGDVVIDGGNAHYEDTLARQEQLLEKGIHFVGAGVSGGEEGALKGPAIMPGGAPEAYKAIEPFLTAIAARDQHGAPCCGYIGAGGSGHFVKMIHNGMEYAEMQLLAELVDYLHIHGRNWIQIAQLLEDWMQGEAHSYLLGITIDILRRKDSDGSPLIEAILDKAGNKGTGGWSNIAASTYGMPATMIASALFARYLSAQREQRLSAASTFDQLRVPAKQGALVPLDSLRQAYQLARLVNHQQGLELIQAASDQHAWKVNLSEVARIWTNGCIIRSTLMEQLVGQLQQGPLLLMHPDRQTFVAQAVDELRTLCLSLLLGMVPSPCFQSAYQYLAGYTQARSSAYLIQAQRDYFGAHTYKRIDDPDGPAHHTDW